MTTTLELRAKLDELLAQHDAIYRELVPKARACADRNVRWADIDLAAWLGTEVDAVRERIVDALQNFLVDDTCSSALLTVQEVVALTDGFNAPRIREVDFVDGQIALTTSRLAELGGN